MTVDWKKKLIPNLPYLLFVYLFDKLCQAVRLAPGLDASEKFLHLSQGFTEAFSSGLPSLHPLDLLAGIAGAVIVRLAVYAKSKNTKKYRKGIEYGSARWGTAADIAPYVDPVPDWNIPLTQTEKLTMSSRPKNPKYARNKNILVIGGSGSGKTRFFVKPSLMQMHSSYVVTDPKGQLLSEVGTMLRRGAPKLDENGKPLRDARGKVIYEPYRIKVLNTINFKKSMKYNPFAYIRSEKDILKLVNVIIANTKGDGEKSSEDFWVKAERLLYCALIGYIWYEAEPEEKNFLTLLELINASEAREDDEEFQSPVDILFAKLEKEHPDHFAVKQYRKFKLAAGKTLKSILISCGARLAPLRYCGAAGDHVGRRTGTGHPGRPKNGAVSHYERYGYHLQLRYRHAAKPAIQSPLRQGGRRVRRQAARPCAVPPGRVRQYRADTQLRQVDRHHPEPGNLGFYYFAEPVAVKGHLQGRCRNHIGQLRFCAFPEWARQKCQGNLRRAGERNH